MEWEDEPTEFLRMTAPSQAITAVATEVSIFDQYLPQEVQKVKVHMPRGQRVHASPRVLGLARADERSYQVTVQPRGRLKKAKELLRETARPLTEHEFDLHQRALGEPQLEELLDEKSCFRAERVRRFEVGRRFPVLVNPRLVPSYRGTDGGKAAKVEADARRQEKGTTLLETTVSTARKQQSKRQSDALAPFVPSSLKDEALYDRKPCLFDCPFDGARYSERDEYLISKGKWVGGATMLPTAVATAKAACELDRQEKDNYQQAMREKGRSMVRRLKEDYSSRRRAYQQQEQFSDALGGGLP